MKRFFDITKCVERAYKEHQSLCEFVSGLDDTRLKILADKDVRDFYLSIIKDIARALKTPNTEIVGAYTYSECWPLAEQCYRTLKMTQEMEANGQELDGKLKNEADMCKIVLPCLYKTMTFDAGITAENMAKIEQELDEVNISKSCLERTSKAKKEENMAM